MSDVEDDGGGQATHPGAVGAEGVRRRDGPAVTRLRAVDQSGHHDEGEKAQSVRRHTSITGENRNKTVDSDRYKSTCSTAGPESPAGRAAASWRERNVEPSGR